MSNRRATAAVTAVLTQRVSEAINGVLPVTEVHNRRPGAAVGNLAPPNVNVYLYRIQPNASLRNAVDPVRDASGRLVEKPAAALDLHYLLTCVGDEEQLEPELLLGAIMTGLTLNPTLPRGLVQSVETTLQGETGNRQYAADSGLDKQIHIVRVTPLDLPLDSLTQLWSSLTSEPYALSVAFEASVVLMSPDVKPAAALPVGGAPTLTSSPLRRPQLTSVRERDDETNPIRIDSTLVLEGEGLRAENTVIRIGALDIAIAINSMTARRIELPLSPVVAGTPTPRDLAPGVLGVQVRHLFDVATAGDAKLRPGPSSDVVPIVLRPTITLAPVTANDSEGDPAIAVAVSPAPNPEWEYYLLLNELDEHASEPRAVVLDEWSTGTVNNKPAVLFKSSSVPKGTWLVRIQINGADSLLEIGASAIEFTEG